MPEILLNSGIVAVIGIVGSAVGTASLAPDKPLLIRVCFEALIGLSVAPSLDHGGQLQANASYIFL